MAKQLKILINPHPILRKKSLEIKPKDLLSKQMKGLFLDMEKTMKEKDGAGLAAPQIGKNIRLIVISDENKTLFLINPKITKKSWAKKIEDEGCLSVLNDKGEIIYAPVSRHKKINCIYLDEKGNKITLAAENLLARVIQHEIDHLNGILFIDYLKNFPNNPQAAKNK
ncbi:MAG TPA: peptide deformylase [Candidatus Saccharimonadales bacterium]|nr:peptide deformylase [Candidatus Saccharimonadales bacterium]